MTDKPGLFSRFKRAISSTLNDAVDAVTDPGQEIALMLDDLADNIRKSELDLKQAIVDQKMMERKLEQLRKDDAAWGKRAEQAVNLGDDTLARAALLRKTELAAEVQATDEALVQQRALVEDVRTGIATAKAKLKSLNLRRGSLMAQARASKQSGGASNIPGDAGAGARMDAIEDKIARLEALNEVAAEGADQKLQEAQIDAKLAQLEANGGGMDDALEQLKAKMRAKALEEGKK
ncbi:MAG: PspA/IM30 family protein [Myxococcales bacterium]|nr:PspA/IM30 family protein [Myxococcales bacterium]